MSSSTEEGGRTAAESVASLRAVAARYPDDIGLRRLIDQLRSESRRFVELWDQSRPRERRSSTKTIRHPELGIIELDCDALHMPESDQRMIVYSAPPTPPAADALALLRVIGLQQLSAAGHLESGSSERQPWCDRSYHWSPHSAPFPAGSRRTLEVRIAPPPIRHLGDRANRVIAVGLDR